MRHLEQQACSVTGIVVTSASTAVHEILERLDAFFNDGMRFFSLDVGDKTDAAGIAFHVRVV